MRQNIVDHLHRGLLLVKIRGIGVRIKHFMPQKSHAISSGQKKWLVELVTLLVDIVHPLVLDSPNVLFSILYG